MNRLEHLSINIPETGKKRVVIIGGGFAGIKLVEGLLDQDYQVVLLDKHNYHTFQPLLYQVATAGLEPDSIAGPLRKLLKGKKDFFFRMLRVDEINPVKQCISTPIGDIRFDYLIVASGSRTNYFGNEEIARLAFPLKKLTDALDLRSQFLQSMEQSVMTRDPEKRQNLLNFVIVGGGPTGVEVAGALAEARKHVLVKDYPELDIQHLQIYLIEGADRLLNGMREKSGEKALGYLKELGVNVKLGRIVKSYDGAVVHLDDGTEIESQTLVWAAGVQGNIIPGLNSSVDRSRYVVDAYNRIQGYENIFAIGDVAAMKSKQWPLGHPMLAPIAMQQAENLGKNFRRKENGKSLLPFKFVDKGTMATVGRNKAVVDLPKGSFGGLFAWLVWMLVHLVSIIGFRNKLVVMSNWFWSYLTYDQGIRLIVRLFKREATFKENKKAA
ncbi:NAD(P)/FAD-dependent oxidoreductase [Xanthovirga aplysinae]|uniref:NAD(P)/FAD-dependent oxidoreductase n=1 Tax=Xanthovirga aplysinae TaxID=2529853 RepID=UPI0012BB6F5D|nr:NAD(P)/FAD-dependent oxidoreductase [Xanthovirga aplysinae]MTI31249.1 NAD(P)/FAD-dependent oxidoreductase [Xanthovirga aplysinae]